jgi:hypothetical protein
MIIYKRFIYSKAKMRQKVNLLLFSVVSIANHDFFSFFFFKSIWRIWIKDIVFVHMLIVEDLFAEKNILPRDAPYSRAQFLTSPLIHCLQHVYTASIPPRGQLPRRTSFRSQLLDFQCSICRCYDSKCF